MNQDRQELRLIALDMAIQRAGFGAAHGIPFVPADEVVKAAVMFEAYLAGPEPEVSANPNVFPINIVSRD